MCVPNRVDEFHPQQVRDAQGTDEEGAQLSKHVVGCHRALACEPRTLEQVVRELVEGLVAYQETCPTSRVDENRRRHYPVWPEWMPSPIYSS